jgi:hypothetical protein
MVSSAIWASEQAIGIEDKLSHMIDPEKKLGTLLFITLIANT